MSGSPSIKDVAAHAGVSLGTVSNVLNRPERGRPSAPASGCWRPSPSSASCATSRPGSCGPAAAARIGLRRARRRPTRSSPTSRAAREEAADGRRARGDRSATAARTPARERRHLDLLEQQRVQGVLITPVDTERPAARALIASRGTPVVLVDRGSGRATAARSRSTTSLGGRLAGDHLLDARPPADRVRRRARRASGRSPTAREGCAARRCGGRDAGDLAGGRDRRASTVAAGRRAGGADRRACPARRGRPPSFCANDLLALGVLQELTRRGPAGARATSRSSATTTSSSPPRPPCRCPRCASPASSSGARPPSCCSRRRSDGERARAPPGGLRARSWWSASPARDAGRPSAVAAAERHADRAVRHLPGRRAVPRRRPGHRDAAASGSGHEVVFPRAQTCCGQMHINTGYQREALPLVRHHVEVFEPLRRRRRAVGLVRRVGAPPARDGRPARAATTRLAERAEAVGGAHLRAVRAAGRRARRRGRRRVLPAPGHLPPDLPLAADAAGRRQAAAAAARTCAASTWSSCPTPTSAAASAARSR